MSGFIENPSAWDCSIWRCLCISQSPAGRADTEYLARDEASILVLFGQVQTSINSLDRRWIERWSSIPVSYTHLRAHETRHDLVCRLLLEKKKKHKNRNQKKNKNKPTRDITENQQNQL